MEASIATNARVLTGPRHAQDEEITSNAVAPILRLHPSLRHRIYLETEILARFQRYEDDKHAVLNLNGGNPIPSYYRYVPECTTGFYGLLVCCRTIYAEASALLYSSNRFIIRYWDKQTLAPLRNLTPSSLSSLTHLKIVLNQSSCHHRDPGCFEDCWGVCDDKRGPNEDVGHESEWKKALHNAPLDIHEPQAKALLDEWHSTAEYLSRHISPEKLELCIVCDVRRDDLESARSTVKPLSLFPELRNCHIRLSRNPTSQLRKMAQDSVLKARCLLGPSSLENITGQAQSTEGEEISQSRLRVECRLLALPRELRFHILGYTDLITPWKEVEWSRHKHRTGKYVALYPKCGITRGYGSCEPRFHHGCQFFNCWMAGVQQSKSAIGCFCQVRHSAASSTCMCWRPPSALFLVCRTLLQDAQVVFFSSNRFVVHDFRVFSPWSTPDDPKPRAQGEREGGGDTEIRRTEFANYHSGRLAASIFLREVVPPRMLREIRELEFVFPPYTHTGWPEEGHPALADWADTLVWARNKLNLGRLTLRLVMTDSLDGHEIPPGRAEITSEQVESILSAYHRITSPLSVLVQTDANDMVGHSGGADELRCFHAEVAWPWDWNWGFNDKIEQYGCAWAMDYRRDRARELKEEAERLVMGKRRNESHVSDRALPWESMWDERFRFEL